MPKQPPPLLVLHAAFVLTGVVTTLLGPALPILASWWHLDDARAGLLFAAQFTGSMGGSVLSSAGMVRVGYRSTLAAGVILMAAGVGTLAVAGHATGVAAICVYGVGLGLTIPTTNLYVAQASSARRASALSVLNLAWGIGAVGAPAIVAMFQRANELPTLLLSIGALLAGISVLLVRLPEPPASAANFEDRETPPSEGARGAKTGALAAGIVLFLYVGTETSVAGWTAAYARRLELIAATLSIATPALFWAALLAGRAAAPAILRRTPETTLLYASLAVATAGVAALPLAGSGVALSLAIAASGLGLSAVFPLVFARFTREQGRDAARAAGSVFVLAGFGGAVLPPLVGIVSTWSGNLAAGLFVPLLGCLTMLAITVWRQP